MSADKILSKMRAKMGIIVPPTAPQQPKLEFQPVTIAGGKSVTPPEPKPPQQQQPKKKKKHKPQGPLFRFPDGTTITTAPFKADQSNPLGGLWTVTLTIPSEPAPLVFTREGTAIHHTIRVLGQEWYRSTRTEEPKP